MKTTQPTKISTESNEEEKSLGTQPRNESERKSKPASKPKPASDTCRPLAIKHSTHKGLKSLSMDLSLPMAATVALLLKGWGSVPEDVRRDLLGLPPLLDGPSGEKLGSWLTEQLQSP